jgi:hypothetical protein
MDLPLHQFVLDRGLDGKLARILSLEDAIGIGRRAPKIIVPVISVGQQAAEFSERTECKPAHKPTLAPATPAQRGAMMTGRSLQIFLAATCFRSGRPCGTVLRHRDALAGGLLCALPQLGLPS